MQKKIFTLFALLLIIVSCNNNKFSNPTDYMKYAGQVGGGSTESVTRFIYYILSIGIEGDGSVLFNDNEYTKELKLLKDTKVRLEAMENNISREKFQGWTGTINSTDKVIPSLLIDKNITILATFGIPKIEKKLIIDVRKGGTIYIDEGNGEVEYKNNTDETMRVTKAYNIIEEESVILWLRAEPNEPAIEWNGWSGLTTDTIMDKKVKVELNATKLISASFGTTRYLSIENDDSKGYIEYSINGSSFTKYSKEVETKIEINDNVRIRAIPHNDRTHELLKWSNGSTQSSIEILDVKGDIILTTTWKEIKRTLTVNKGTGNVKAFIINDTTHQYNGTPITVPILRDSEITIKAVEKYYPITSWTGADETATNATIATLKLKEDTSVVANFGTGAFDVYDNPTYNGYNASYFDNWILDVPDFGNEEIPQYIFNTYAERVEKVKVGGTIIKPIYEYRTNRFNFKWSEKINSLGSTTVTEYTYGEGQNSKAMGFDISKMNYFLYKGINYYMMKDHGYTNKYNSGWNANRLERFYFYRFTGNTTAGGIANSLCAVDTYTKLVYGYAIPDDFVNMVLSWAPSGWWSVEDKVKQYKGEDFKFYEYNPIGWVNSDGEVILFQAFKTIQSDASKIKTKWKGDQYLPKSEAIAGAAVQMDITKMNVATPIRSPYYER